MSDGGKGSTQRPTDQKAYANNYDRIFAQRQRALDKKAENARELGLDYEPIKDEGSTNASDKETRRLVLGEKRPTRDQTESHSSGSSSPCQRI